jgi:hypothetical protein
MLFNTLATLGLVTLAVAGERLAELDLNCY